MKLEDVFFSNPLMTVITLVLILLVIYLVALLQECRKESEKNRQKFNKYLKDLGSEES